MPSRGIEPATLCSAIFASSSSSGLVLPASGALVQWLSSRMYVQVVTVAFWCLEVFQTAPCTSYPSKQQRPTAWITALRYQCPLNLTFFLWPLCFEDIDGVSF